MDEATKREEVRQRANNRCEYCGLPQEFYDLTFHVEHVIATQHRIDDSPANFALACDRCNLHKGPNLSSVDPDADEIVNLFNPRTQNWDDHFSLIGAEIIGLTPEGRATAKLLHFNSKRRIVLRKRLIDEGVY